MTDLEKAAEEFVSAACGRLYPGDGYDNGHRDFGADDLHGAFLVGAEHARPKWISVEDELPSSTVRVLAFVYGNVDMGFINHDEGAGDWRHWEGNIYKYIDKAEHAITHWMPLPKSPYDEPLPELEEKKK